MVYLLLRSRKLSLRFDENVSSNFVRPTKVVPIVNQNGVVE